MDLNSHVEKLHRNLVATADAIGPEARTIADRIATPLNSIVWRTILEALSDAAEEATRDLAPASIQVQLREHNPHFVLTPPCAARTPTVKGSRSLPPDLAATEDEDATVRLNFRLPASVKARVEEAAGNENVSLNRWLLRTVSEALAADEQGGGRGNNVGQCISRPGVPVEPSVAPPGESSRTS